MQMIRMLVYLAFIISAAMTAGGIMMSAKLRAKYKNELFPLLLYHQVFIYTFGFYGIWGQVILKSYLSAFVSAEVITRITDISMLLGLPFLVFGWLMLVRFACGLAGRICSQWFVTMFLVVNFAIIAFLFYLLREGSGMKPAELLKAYFIVMHLISSAVAAAVLAKGTLQSQAGFRGRIIVSALVSAGAVLQCVLLFFYDDKTYTGTAFIIAFFTGNAAIPAVLTYGGHIKIAETKVKQALSMDEFCTIYEISPREKEIIAGICDGLSNKEIADKLFISLQTVKDHTSRIYYKTNVKSRVQLINLVNNTQA